MSNNKRTVWITGASYGLGRSLATLMAQNGWRVAVSARSGEELEAFAKQSQKWSGTIFPAACDITDLASVKSALSKIEEELGPIDIAVLNAGTHAPIRARDFKSEAFQKLVDINLMGTVHCLDGVLPYFLKRQAGQIAVVSSVAGYRGLPTSSGYGMTKAGLINMVEALKPELDMENIKVQLVCPGFVRTPLTDKNDFEMPFLMEAEDAAKAFYKGLMSNRFEIVFPWQMGLIFKFIRMLPSKLAFMITKGMIPDEKENDA